MSVTVEKQKRNSGRNPKSNCSVECSHAQQKGWPTLQKQDPDCEKLDFI